MIGLDTNVVLRYLLQDDPAQTLQANRIFEQELSDPRARALMMKRRLWGWLMIGLLQLRMRQR
jgi:hypothetical protein